MTEIKRLLAKRTGFAPETLGPDAVERAALTRMTASGHRSEMDYLAVLTESQEELDRLIEEIVIPESWFFRDRAPFELLSQRVLGRRPPPSADAPFRVLSAPCAAGEEPFSIGMTLLDAGLPPEAFRVEGVDISQRLVDAARRRVFVSFSFRGEDISYRDRHFIRRPDGGFALTERLNDNVGFRRANLTDPEFLKDDAPYDAIFCRNVLIYLDADARERIVGHLERLLAEDGILFAGHAEAGLSIFQRFQPAGINGAFAFYRRTFGDNPVKRAALKPRPARVNGKTRFNAASRRLRGASSRPAVFAGPKAPGDEAVQPVSKAMDLASAEALANEGKVAEAESLCLRSLESEGPSAAAFFLLAVIHMAKGSKAEAEQCLNKAVYLEPGHTDAMAHLALLAKARGDEPAALNWRRRLERAAARNAQGS